MGTLRQFFASFLLARVVASEDEANIERDYCERMQLSAKIYY